MEDENKIFWLCLYQFSGQETEGYLRSEKKFICEAIDRAEALYKYHIWLAFRNSKRPKFESLSEYRKNEYASGGWGYFTYRLNGGKNFRDDNEYFYEQCNNYFQ